jgi:EF-hand domain pair
MKSATINHLLQQISATNLLGEKNGNASHPACSARPQRVSSQRTNLNTVQIYRAIVQGYIKRGQQKRERDLSLRKAIGGIGVALGLLLASAPALAQSDPADDKVRPDPLKAGADSWDANHDGVYTCDEWKKHLDRVFTLADRNHDGRLDVAEFATVKKADPALADADFGYFDENQDGKVTREEFVSKPSEFILRFDKNGDCRVTQDEIKAGSTPAQVGPKQPTRDRFHTY